MKKLIAMIGAVVTSLGLSAAETESMFATSFEGDEWSSAADNGWTWADATTQTTQAYSTDDVAYTYSSAGDNVRRDAFTNVAQSQYLKLEGAALTNSVTGGGVVVDQLVRFSTSDEVPTIGENAKIVVWMKEEFDENNEATATNLYVTAYDNTNGCATNIPVTVANVNWEIGKWYRLTIKSLGNVMEEGQSERGGFLVFIDGLAATYASDVIDLTKIKTGDSLVNSFATSKKLFLSLKESSEIAKLIYEGSGAIDDLVVDETGPAFVNITLVAVAQVGGTSYATLAEAIAAAGAGGTITIINSDITWPETIPEGITFVKGEGVTLDAPDGYKWNDDGALVVIIAASVTGGAMSPEATDGNVTFLYNAENKTITFTPEEGYELGSVTVNGNAVEGAALVDGTYTYTYTAGDTSVAVVFEKVINTTPTVITIAETNQGNGTLGTISTTATEILSYTELPYTVTAASGYVIGQVLTNGVAIAEAFGKSTFDFTAVFGNVDTDPTPSITVSYVVEGAWYLDPFVRNDFLVSENAYNASVVAKDEVDESIVYGISKTGYYDTNNGILQFNLADLADSLDTKVKPINGSKKWLSTNQEQVQDVAVSKAAGFALTGSSKGAASDTREYSIAWPLGGEWGDSNYGATKDNRVLLKTDMPKTYQRLAPLVFGTDGQYVYGNNFYQPEIYQLAFAKDDDGNVTNLLCTGKSWLSPSGSYASSMTAANFNGNDLIYFVASWVLYAIDTATDEIITVSPSAGMGTKQMAVTGIESGTPHIIMSDNSKIKVFALADDGRSVLSTTPIVTLEKAKVVGDALTDGSWTGFTTTRDETHAFFNSQWSGNIVRGYVVEQKPANLTVRAVFDGEAEADADDYSVAFAAAANVEIVAPTGRMITAVKVDGVAVTGFEAATSYTFTAEALTDHAYVELTTEAIKYAITWSVSGVEGATVTATVDDAAITSGAELAPGTEITFAVADNADYTIKSVGGVDGVSTYTVGTEAAEIAIVVAAAAQTVSPGGEAVQVNAESETEAAEAVTLVATSPDVAIVSTEAYTAYFTKKATPNGEGAYLVEAVLRDDIVKAEDVTAEIAAVLDEVASGTEDSATVTKAKPGLYYSVKYSNDVSAMKATAKETDRVLATGTPVSISLPKVDNSNAMFYKIPVNAVEE